MKWWYALRSCAYYVVFFTTSALWVWTFMITAIFSFKLTYQAQRLWCWFNVWCCRWLCGLRYEVRGKENLQDLPVIFFSKHQSAWETIALPFMLPYSCFVAKQSLFQIPFFGWGMYFAKHIPIDRTQGIKALKKVIAHGKDRIDRGISILLFPEGTRVAPGETVPFHKSGAMLAKAVGRPVVPIAHNAGQCWRRNSFVKYPGKITVVIGPPIDITGMNVEQINQSASDWICATMASIEAPAGL